MLALSGSYAPTVIHGRMLRARLPSHGAGAYYQLIVVQEGSYLLRLGEQEWQGQPGDVLLVPPGASYESSSHQDCRSALVAFTVMATPLVRRSRRQVLVVPEDAPPQPPPEAIWGCAVPVQLSGAVADAVRDPIVYISSIWWRSDQQHFAANQRLAYVLERIVASAQEQSIHVQSDVSVAENLVARVLHVIHRQYASIHKADEMARLLGISVSHLNQAFKRQTGETPVAALRRYRLAEAARLLILWDDDIRVVAMAVGFRSGKALHQAWMQQYDCPPSEWRRRQRPM